MYAALNNRVFRKYHLCIPSILKDGATYLVQPSDVENRTSAVIGGVISSMLILRPEPSPIYALLANILTLPLYIECLGYTCYVAVVKK